VSSVNHWVLAEANYGQVRDAAFEVAVLPFGATEPHNLHLPYGTDMFEGDAIGRAICGEAVKRGAKVVLLPTIPFGNQTNMRRFPLALNLNPSTLLRVADDLVESLVNSGLRKILLLNMHGGNELKSTVRELSSKHEVQLFICNWWEVLADVYDEIFDEPEDHAGEMETSVALACFPDLVAREPAGGLAADDGTTRPFRFEAMRRGWVRTSRAWHLLTSNSGAGNPHAATREKGERAIGVLVERLAPFLVELSRADLDASFPFEDVKPS
jgi:creatinine amidohydrolase